jgi:hypothetical protein
VLATAGVQLKLTIGWSLLAKFDGTFSATTSSYAGTAVVRKAW